jgi:hypothetical protein
LGVQEPSAAWPTLEFDDSTWEWGPSGFGTIYFPAATVIPEMLDSCPSLYLRHLFSVPQPKDLTWLILRVDYGGGFVAYLNGHEVARRGLPGAAGSRIPFDALAEPHQPGTAEEIDLSPFLTVLSPGPNVLAIQAHNSSLGNSAWGIVPELMADFTRGPALQNVSTHQAVILWRTPVPADSAVEYGPTPELEFRQASPQPALEHAVTLTGLEPGQDYYYRVSSTTGQISVRSDPIKFRTLKSQGDLSFVVVGDTGSGLLPQYQVAKIMRELSPDLVLHLGDVIYPTFTLGQVDLRCFSVYEPQMRQTPFFFVFGNHDSYDSPTNYIETFYLPTNALTGTERFYSFDHGDAHFACLDSIVTAGADYHPGSPQYQWLDADLAATRKPWKFVCLHNPLRSSGIHRNDDFSLNGVPDRLELQESIGRLAARHQVQVIFQAHDHLYERFNPVDGVYTITSGGGGYSLYPFGGTWDEATCQIQSLYHCVQVTVAGDQLELQAVGVDGNTFDRMHLRRTTTPRRIYESAWHSPLINGACSGQTDANGQGPRLDFAGESIPAKAGSWANLGRLHVNHDNQYLYLGLDQCMIYSNQVVLLFLECPGLSGVSQLYSLGNGRVDPDQEGVDGLDFLNLRFTSFTPAVACLLGDELADGQHRSFARPGADINTGQGVFYLLPALNDVPGVYLQQYHRLPPTESVPGKQNADVIELAIPLSQLGDLRSGDRIKIGAVVAQFVKEGDLMRIRSILDPGFLGTYLSEVNADLPVLEGVEVVLGSEHPHPLRVWLTLLPKARVRISWSAVPGKKYAMEWSSSVTGPFQPVDHPSFPMVASATTGCFEQEWGGQSPPTSARFYRVRLVE